MNVNFDLNMRMIKNNFKFDVINDEFDVLSKFSVPLYNSSDFIFKLTSHPHKSGPDFSLGY